MTKPAPHQLTAWAVFLAITGAYLIAAVYFPIVFVWATYEDLYGEWGQTYAFVAAFLLSLQLARSSSRYRWFFAALAAVCFYAFMEEISWGQRIFGIESPGFFKRYNLQRETNIHNLLVGPVSTETKAYVEYAVASALLLYGLVYPLMLRLGWAPARWLDRLGVAAPPLYTWPFFVTAAWLELGPLSFNETEVAEMLVPFALAVMAAQYLFAQRRGMTPDAALSEPGGSRRFSGQILGIIAGVAVAAAATTAVLLSIPDQRERIEGRLSNGYEKFARRYERYDRYDVSVDLWLRLHEEDPERTFVLRRLANAHRELGDREKFELYTRKALDVALAEHVLDPNHISVNLSLSRTYRQLGEYDKYNEHAQRALRLALERAAAEPDSAHWAYWVGKTARNLGNYQLALTQFRRAYDLDPGSMKYRGAYVEMRQATGQ